MGNPWVKLLHDDNLLHGRNWPLVPLWIVVAPYFFRRMRSRASLEERVDVVSFEIGISLRVSTSSRPHAFGAVG